MSESRRVVPGYTIRRDDETGEILLDAGEWEYRLTADDLLALLAFAETGQEPAATQQEQQAAEKGQQDAKWLDSLVNE